MNTFKDHLAENRIDNRKAAVDKARKYVEGIASEVAKKHESYEEFAAHMRKLIPKLEWDDTGGVIVQHETGPIHISMNWMWEAHNPRKREEHRKSWDSYGEARARGEYASKDGWTGD